MAHCSCSGQLDRPVGSRIMTGPYFSRLLAVAYRTSVFEEVASTLPGKSRIHGMISCEVLPSRGGATIRTVSSNGMYSFTPVGIAVPQNTSTSLTGTSVTRGGVLERHGSALDRPTVLPREGFGAARLGR